MSAIPVGYEAFQSRRRMGVTLVCFLLASSIAMSIAVYVDSYSMHQWDEYLDVGDIHLAVYGGFDVGIYEEDVRSLPGVRHAAFMKSSWVQVLRNENASREDIELQEWGRAVAPDEDFVDEFPNVFQVQEGRLPQTDQEVAVTYEMHAYLSIDIGEKLNISFDYLTQRELEVVGVYTQQNIGAVSPYGYSFGYESFVIVYEILTTEGYYEDAIFASIDISPITPFSPQYSLSYVSGIDERIRRLDPLYDPPRRGSSLYVENFIASGIGRYIVWVQALRVGQVARSMSVFLLAGLVTFLAIRYNTNERRFERNMLISRGASPSDLDSAINREVFIISVGSCIMGIPLGTLFSRIAMAANGYFTFDVGKVFSEPFLVSLDSVVIACVVGVALPMVTLAVYRGVYSTKKSMEERRGKLAKAVRVVQFIRWDMLVVLLAILLLVALPSGSSVPSSVALILQLVPLALFLGVSSLAIKALRAGANLLSKIFKPMLGEIPASIGVRRIGKSASSAGSAIMVLVLAVCLSWNSAIVDLSLPSTQMNHARLEVGADLTFALDPASFELWTEFSANVSLDPDVLGTDMASELALSLSADDSGFASFLAVNPDNYSRIGFSYLGQRLNESNQLDLLMQLEATPDGVIITSDLAKTYDIRVGDTLRASDLNEFDPHTYGFRIVGITEALPEMPADDTFYFGPYGDYYEYPLAGRRRAMVNREYLSTVLNLTADTRNYLCVRTREGSNSTKIGLDVLDRGGQDVLLAGTWDSVQAQVDEMVGQTGYEIERAIDTMLTFLTVGTIIGAFALYAAEGVRARKREIALLRSIGAGRGVIAAAQAAEMFVLLMFGTGLLAGYGPLFVGTTVAAAIGATITDAWLFPVSSFVVVPWMTVGVVLLFFFVLASTFIIIISLVSSRIHLASALNAAWAEAGPYGGDV